MRNPVEEIIEDHFLTVIFLTCITVIIAFMMTINSTYTSATYYSELVYSEVAIISALILSFLARIVVSHYKY